MILFKRVVVPFSVCAVLSLVGVVGYRVWYADRLLSLPFTMLPTSFRFQPPSQAVQVYVSSSSGIPVKHDRNDNQEQVKLNIPIMQGESVETDRNSWVTVTLADIGLISISPESSIHFVSLMPGQLLIHQEQGEALYELESEEAFGVRAMAGLIRIASGAATIRVDETRNRIYFREITGAATFAYQDAKHNTYVVPLPLEEHAYYDNSRRIIVE